MGPKTPLPGRVMINMPMKPTPTALQRRQPTCSPSNGTEKVVRKMGAESPMATASASGIRAKA